MSPEINSTIELCGKRFRVQEAEEAVCTGCYFENLKLCPPVDCDPVSREDGRPVIFVIQDEK